MEKEYGLAEAMVDYHREAEQRTTSSGPPVDTETPLPMVSTRDSDLSDPSSSSNTYAICSAQQDDSSILTEWIDGEIDKTAGRGIAGATTTRIGGSAEAPDDARRRNLGEGVHTSVPVPVVVPTAKVQRTSLANYGGRHARRTSNLFAARNRFRRQRGSYVAESDASKEERFWAGVRPMRQSSTVGLGIGKAAGTGALTIATLRAAIKLKKKAVDFKAKSILSAYTLDPRSPRMLSWKNWMFVNIMYAVLVVPWRISFGSDVGPISLTFNVIVNVSFVIDTVLHFFTAIPTESGLMTDRKVIIRRYLSTWFVLDLITCLPLTTLLRDRVYPSLRVITPMRAVRLMGLLKVVKVYAMHYEVSARVIVCVAIDGLRTLQGYDTSTPLPSFTPP